MIELVVGFAIAAVLLIAEYLLCTKLKSPLWGGIIPVLILAGTIWVFASGRIPLETRYLFPFVVLNTLFLEIGEQAATNTRKLSKQKWTA